MGASFMWFTKYKQIDNSYTPKGFVKPIDEDHNNHSYGGIYTVIEFLTAYGIDFNEYVDYTDGHNVFDPKKLQKQKLFLTKLKELVSKLEKIVVENKEVKDDLDYCISWFKIWIKKIEEGYYIAYTL